MERQVWRMLGCIGAISLVAGFVSVAAGQVKVEQEDNLLVGRQQFEAKVLRVKDNRLELQLSEPEEQRVINLSPELLAKLHLVSGRSYNILANQTATPGGISAGVRLNDEQGLYAIAESFQDMPALQPAEREGIKIEQLPAQNRTIVYQDSCKIVYEVPTEFTVGDQRIVLNAYETKAVQINNIDFRLSLNSSRFVVLKDCLIPFEGGQSIVNYTLVRS